MTVPESHTHFDEMTGLLYLEQQLDDGRSKAMEAHAQACANCRELLRVLNNESVWLRGAMASDEEPVPARLLGVPERSSTHWGWMAALGFGAAGAYSLWTGVVDPWITQASNMGVTQGNLMTMLFFSGAFWSGWDEVLRAVEVLALASLAGVAVWGLRRFFRRQTRVAVAAILGALVFVMAPLTAHAADTEHGNPNYTLPAGQEVKTDLFVAADHAVVDGDVDGDLIVWAHEVEVNGQVKGDIIAFTQQLRVNGRVDGNVRTFAQSAMVHGTVARNLMAFAGTTEVDEKASVGGSVTTFSQDVQLNGPVKGDVMAFAANLNVNAPVGGDVKMRGEKLRIAEDAQITGKTHYIGPNQPDVAPGAKMASPMEVEIKIPTPQYERASYYTHQLFRWGAALVFGIVFFLVAPGVYLDAAHAAQRGGLAMGLGVLFFAGIPVAALIACATIIGLGVGLVTLLVYIVVIYASQIFVGAWLGEKLMGSATGTGHILTRLAVGLAILRVVRIIPFIGPTSVAMVIMWGIGAYVMTIHKRIRQQAAVA